MGCSASKVKNAEDVSRCRARRRLMKQAVASRHQFAAAHAAYIQAMKNVGAAFRQFGETEIRETASATKSSMESPERPLPPPPPPAFSPRVQLSPSASPTKQQRHDEFKKPEVEQQEGQFYYRKSPPRDHTILKKHEGESTFYYMDEEKVGKEYYYTAPPPPPVPATAAPPPPSPPRASAWDFLDPFRPPESPMHLQKMKKLQMMKQEHEACANIAEDEEEELDDEDDDELASNPEKAEELAKSASVGAGDQGSGKQEELAIILMPAGGIGHKELLDVVKEVDELFLRAYEGGKCVSKLLEARKVHYHSNFMEYKGYESHSKRVLQAISLHRGSSRSPMAALKVVASEDHLSSPDEAGPTGSHAATLDRLLAWEKKLYDEVKSQEEPSDSIKVTIKSLSTKLQVSLQGVDTAISAINKLKEDELHGQLVVLIEGMMNMWNLLYDCHRRQYRSVAEMKSTDHWGAVEPTTNIHRMATSQLELAIVAWSAAFNKLVCAQREYLHSLTGWMRLSNMPLDIENLQESPGVVAGGGGGAKEQLVKNSMLQLCQDWSLAVDRLPDKVASESIKSFAAVVHKMLETQSEEVKLRKKVDALTKEYDKKSAFPASAKKKKKLNNKLKKKLQLVKEEDPEEDRSKPVESLELDSVAAAMLMRGSRASSRVSSVNALKEKLDEEKNRVARAVFNTRAMTINSLHTGLPSIFQSVAAFGRISLHAYQSLYCQAHNNALLRITEG